MLTTQPPPRRLDKFVATHFDDIESEEEGNDGEIEVLCNIRVEQAVLGRTPLVRSCRETTLGFTTSGGVVKADMKTNSVGIRIVQNPNARIHGNRITEGKICIRDVRRNIMIMVSDADPQDLRRLKELIMEATGTAPRESLRSPKRSPCHKRKPLTAVDGNARSPKRSKLGTPSASKDDEDGEAVSLTDEQMAAVEAALEGRSIFITGGAGTGKSVVLREVIRRLPRATSFVTASTGVAACNVNGCTLHHFAGIGRSDRPVDELAARISRSEAGDRWRRAKTLVDTPNGPQQILRSDCYQADSTKEGLRVIDEISMVSGDTFDALNRLGQLIRNSKQPFGGIQLVLCGDFFQLPPVSDGPSGGAKLCFEAAAWEKAVERTVQLRECHRQKDAKFIRILEDIRWGKCTKAVLAMMSERAVCGEEQREARATRLMTHRNDVQRTNDHALQRLEGEARSFDATDDGDSQATRALNTLCTAPPTLSLKIGAQVILLKTLNAGRGLVNGARGEVVAFTKGLGVPVVRFDNGERETLGRETWGVNIGGGRTATRCQIPLGLAWAMSIHKSQGISLSSVHVSLSRVFEAGQAYVALSRARTLKGLGILDFSPTAIRADHRVLAFYRAMKAEEGGGGS